MSDLPVHYRKPDPPSSPPSDLDKVTWYLKRANRLLLCCQAICCVSVTAVLTTLILLNLIQTKRGLLVACVLEFFAQMVAGIVLARRMERVALVNIHLNIKHGRVLPAQFRATLKRIQESYPRFSSTPLKVLPDSSTKELPEDIIL